MLLPQQLQVMVTDGGVRRCMHLSENVPVVGVMIVRLSCNSPRSYSIYNALATVHHRRLARILSCLPRRPVKPRYSDDGWVETIKRPIKEKRMSNEKGADRKLTVGRDGSLHDSRWQLFVPHTDNAAAKFKNSAEISLLGHSIYA